MKNGNLRLTKEWHVCCIDETVERTKVLRIMESFTDESKMLKYVNDMANKFGWKLKIVECVCAERSI